MTTTISQPIDASEAVHSPLSDPPRDEAGRPAWHGPTTTTTAKEVEEQKDDEDRVQQERKPSAADPAGESAGSGVRGEEYRKSTRVHTHTRHPHDICVLWLHCRRASAVGGQRQAGQRRRHHEGSSVGKHVVSDERWIYLKFLTTMVSAPTSTNTSTRLPESLSLPEAVCPKEESPWLRWLRVE